MTIDKSTQNDFFVDACTSGNYEEAKKVDIEMLSNTSLMLAFTGSCIHGHLTIAKWLQSKLVVSNIDVITHVFTTTCTYGHIETAQWLHNVYFITNQQIGKNTLLVLCTHPNVSLDIIKWLMSISENVTDSDTSYIFKKMCKCGNTVGAKWCWAQIQNLDKTIKFEQFKDCCCTGNLELLKFLYLEVTSSHTSHASHASKLIHNEDEMLFRSACINNYLSIVEWLYSLGNINIFSNNHDAFRTCCSKGNILVAKFLHKMAPDVYTLELNAHGTNIEYWTISDVNKWILSEHDHQKKQLTENVFNIMILNRIIVFMCFLFLMFMVYT